MSSDTREVMTVEQAAEYLQINPKTLYRWLAEGRAPGQKLSRNVWRLLKADLDAWLTAHPEAGAGLSARDATEAALSGLRELREKMIARRGGPFPEGFGAKLVREGRR